MNTRFSEYLASIGMGSALIARAESVFDALSVICPEEIEHIFVSEYVTSDGNREYEHLLCLAKGYVCEATHFQKEEDTEYFLVSVKKTVSFIKLDRKDYDMKKAQPTSRFSIDAPFVHHNFHLEYRASGENCDKLLLLVKQYLVPEVRDE